MTGSAKDEALAVARDGVLIDERIHADRRLEETSPDYSPQGKRRVFVSMAISLPCRLK